MEKFKKILGSLWKWLKENWLVVLVIVGVAALAFRGCSQEEAYSNLFDHYNEQSKDHERQIQELRSLQDQERAERERILQEYLAELHRIEQEYKEELGRIEQQREDTQSDIIRDHDRDPTTLTTAVTETFGIPVE